jgi:Protein of unknown function (DUF3465)
MQQLTKLLPLSLLLCLLPSGLIAQKSSRKTRRPSPQPIICKISSVPNGMVVVGYKRNSACSDGAELLVKRPENGDIICAESPLPPQFSIATEAQGASVGTCPNRAFLISGASARFVDDDPIGRAFANRASDIQVEGEGMVVRVLSDDMNGSRHQRLIVQLASGQTLLITHNIDVAPRIDGLEEGDSVRFFGEYVWNAKGGLIHWTHHDPRGKHVAGWVIHNGKTYK